MSRIIGTALGAVVLAAMVIAFEYATFYSYTGMMPWE